MGTVTKVFSTSAHVTGDLGSPDGMTLWRFDVSTDGVNWSVPDGGYTGEEVFASKTVEADLKNLAPETQYFVRFAVVDFGNGQVETISAEPNPSFTTTLAVTPTPPSVLATDNATGVDVTSAEVSGEVKRAAGEDPLFDADCRFEYVTDAQFNATGFDGAAQTACKPNPVSTPGASSVEAILLDLSAETTYHLRLTASNSGGSDSKEAASTFTTGSATAPALAVDPPAEVKYTEAQISGSIDPEGGNTDVRQGTLPILWQLQYRLASEPGNWQQGASGTIEGAEAESSGTPINVPASPAQLTGLAASSEYKFRLLATYAGLDAISSEGSFTTDFVAKPVLTVEPASSVTDTSAHFEGTVEAGGDDPAFNSNCIFDYVTEAQYAAAAPGEEFAAAQLTLCDVNPVTGTGETDVSANVSGLLPGTTYHLRLRSSNAGGESVTEAPTFTTSITTYASAVGASSATLNARLNPGGVPTTFHFEYLTLAEYEANGETFAGAKATPESSSIGQDDTAHAVLAEVTGLQSATAYRFRVVVSNSTTPPGGLAGPVKGFLTKPAPAPDSCSNASIRGAQGAGDLAHCRAWELVSPDLNHASLSNAPRGLSMPDGNAMVYYSVDAPDQAESAGVENYTYASRNPSTGWSGKSILPALSEPITGFFTYGPVAYSSDGKSVLMKGDQAPPGASLPPGPPQSHLWLARVDGTADRLTNVGQPYEPGREGYPAFNGVAAYYDFKAVFYVAGQPQTEETDPSPGQSWYFWRDGVIELLAVGPDGPLPNGEPAGGALPPISQDASRILFRSVGDTGLYLRLGAAPGFDVTESQRTVEPDPNPTPFPQPVGITGDGSKVLFLSAAELTNDAYTGRSGGVANDAGKDLYSYDVASGELTDLTVHDDPADAATGANVIRVLAVNGDVSRIFFVATGNLAPGGTSGEPSIYYWHDGEIEYVAPWSGVDQVGASPDTNSLAFTAIGQPTGYDNVNPATGAPVLEAYVWRPGSGLECASCRPDGSPPTSNVILTGISNNGEHVFFQTADQILPQASSGKSAVYEYSEGRVTPISRLGGETDSLFISASPSGNDVFFATHDDLVPNKNSGDYMVYDARVGGGFPLAPQGCSGVSCQGSASAPPAASAPASSALSGAGNPRMKACPKGKVRKHGKCVKKGKKKHRQQKGKPRKDRSGGAK